MLGFMGRIENLDDPVDPYKCGPSTYNPYTRGSTKKPETNAMNYDERGGRQGFNLL